MFTQTYSLTVKTRLQIKCSTTTDEKLFRMSSCSHKWHNYDQIFFEIFLISLCITKRQYECSKSRWKFSGKKTFFRLSNYFDPEKCGNAQQTFFHCTPFFLFWFWCNEMFVRIFLSGQRCCYIHSTHLYHLLIRLKVQNCHGGKKSLFPPRDEVNRHFRQDLFRLHK